MIIAEDDIAFQFFTEKSISNFRVVLPDYAGEERGEVCFI